MILECEVEKGIRVLKKGTRTRVVGESERVAKQKK